MKNQILQIIRAHNNELKAFETSNVKVPMEVFMLLASVSSAHATVGLKLAQLARANGVECKCNMQSGFITVIGGDEE